MDERTRRGGHKLLFQTQSCGERHGWSLWVSAKSIGAPTVSVECGAGLAVERAVNPSQQPLNCRA
jgi:hypothetical protein